MLNILSHFNPNMLNNLPNRRTIKQLTLDKRRALCMLERLANRNLNDLNKNDVVVGPE